MPNAAVAEVYFIVAMMILILIVSAASVFFFFRQLKREKNAPKITYKKPASEKKTDEQEYVAK